MSTMSKKERIIYTLTQINQKLLSNKHKLQKHITNNKHDVDAVRSIIKLSAYFKKNQKIINTYTNRIKTI